MRKNIVPEKNCMLHELQSFQKVNIQNNCMEFVPSFAMYGLGFADSYHYILKYEFGNSNFTTKINNPSSFSLSTMIFYFKYYGTSCRLFTLTFELTVI